MTTHDRTSRISLALLFALLVTGGVFSSRLMAQDSGVSVTVQVAEQPGEVRQLSSLGQQGTDFAVRPSVYTPEVTRPEKLLLDLRCINNTTGQVIPFCNLILSWQVRPFTGGHNHDDGGRPRGTFEPSSGNTGSSGVLTTTYTAPEPSGIIQIILSGYLSDGTPVNASSYTIGVEVSGLVPIGAGTGYDFAGITADHPDSHNGTPSFNGMLKTLADSYVSAFPGYLLHYNDMSLPLGGVLDLEKSWHYPHKAHRYGTNIDVRLVPPQQRRQLVQLIHASGIRGILDESKKNHWHLTQ